LVDTSSAFDLFGANPVSREWNSRLRNQAPANGPQHRQTIFRKLRKEQIYAVASR